MKARYVNELAEGARSMRVFALRAKEMRAARTGEAYLVARARRPDRADSGGAASARSPRPSAVPVGVVVRVRGTVTSFRGTKRVSVDSLQAARHLGPRGPPRHAGRAIERGTARRVQGAASIGDATAALRALLERGLRRRGVLRAVLARARRRSPTTTPTSAGCSSTPSPSRRLCRTLARAVSARRPRPAGRRRAAARHRQGRRTHVRRRRSATPTRAGSSATWCSG